MIRLNIPPELSLICLPEEEDLKNFNFESKEAVYSEPI